MTARTGAGNRPIEVACTPRGEEPATRGIPSPSAMRTIRMMHVLERVARHFNEAGVPLMVLKGAALQLTLCARPDERPMVDVDLLVRPGDADRAMVLLESLGYHRGQAAFREDFFPKYYYEVEYRVGMLAPFEFDLHVRPFRVMRYARCMPDDAFWIDAVAVRLGEATVFRPSDENMLLHLAAHSAIHGNPDPRWLDDLRRWIGTYGPRMNWPRLLGRARRWRLSGAVASALHTASNPAGNDITANLRRHRTTWQDRLALWHAPRDREHLARSFLVNLLTAPGWRFKLGYARDVLLPDREYLGHWSTRKGCRWPRAASMLRWVWPVLGRLPGLHREAPIQVRSSGVHGLGVFATRDIARGERIARYHGRPVERDGTYVSQHTDRAGRTTRHEITGPLKYLNHSCRPNTELHEFRLTAIVDIPEGREVTMSYGDGVCNCGKGAHP